MKFINKIKKLFSNKYQELDRKEINTAIIKFEDRKLEYENDLKGKEELIFNYFEKGKLSKSLNEKKALTQKIVVLKKQANVISNRLQFINKKIQVLEQFKIAIDDRDFNRDTKNNELEKLLGNTDKLQSFLNEVVSEKELQDEKLLDQLNIFDDSLSSYTPNEEIYGDRVDEQSILAMMTEDISDTKEENTELKNIRSKESL